MKNGGGLENHSCESEIQSTVQRALLDCIDVGDLKSSLGVNQEVCFSAASVLSMGSRADAIVFVKDTSAITGVAEVKLPGFNFEHIHQIVDYMIDLRNSFNVRYVFGVLTTYEAWKILWFEDSNEAAILTSKLAYDELCMAGSANEYVISEKVTVIQSQLYKHSDLSLIECLVSLVYKIGKSPLYLPNKFIDARSRYIFATKNSISYRFLPKTLVKFSFSMPTKKTRNLFILSYFHRGGDGSVALCCSGSGNLAVVKFLTDGGTEKLGQEQAHWRNIWGVECRIVNLNNRDGLLMPFCMPFNVHKRRDGNAWFCSLHIWNKILSNKASDFEEVSDELEKCIDYANLKYYQSNPIKVAEKALETMTLKGTRHDDLEWRHFALLPVLNENRVYEFKPILIDLTRVETLPVNEAREAALQGLIKLTEQFELMT